MSRDITIVFKGAAAGTSRLVVVVDACAISLNSMSAKSTSESTSDLPRMLASLCTFVMNN